MDVIITSTQDVSIYEIEKELLDGSLLGRPVTILDRMPLSDRNLTAVIDNTDEMWTLRNDSRILQVERLAEMDARTKVVHDTVQNINPILDNFLNPTHDNWALDYCTEDNGNTYTYTHAGEGVDVVIMDSGIKADHVEFLDDQGQSRVQQIEWKANQNVDRPNFYTDQDGHGTHVAGTAAGLTQGWARKSDIYVMKIFDTNAYSVLEGLQLVRQWHNNKSNGRPTVINMSWGYSTEYPANYPDAQLAGQPHPVRVASTDAEVESMITDGIFVISSAGNSNAYVAETSDSAYNDFYYTDADFNYLPSSSGASFIYYYKRKSPAGADNVICVGSIGDLNPSADKDIRSYFSNYGTRIDLFAPGFGIQSADYQTISGLIKMAGTSMASPQVAGIVAILLSMYITYSLSKLNAVIEFHGKKDIIPVSPELGGATNLVIRSIVNGFTYRHNGSWKALDLLTKQNGEWKRLKSVHSKQIGTINKVFG